MLERVSLDALTRVFEAVFLISIVAGVFSLRWPIIGVALSAGLAVCLSRYVCADTVERDCARIEPVQLAHTKDDVGDGRDPPLPCDPGSPVLVRTTNDSPDAYARARDQATNFPNRVAQRIAVAQSEESNRMPVSAEARRAFMVAHAPSMTNRASAYVAETDEPACPVPPLSDALENAVDRRQVGTYDARVPHSLPIVGTSRGGD